MKILGMKSVVKIGTVCYVVENISKNGVTLVSNKKTIFALSDILENLRLGTLTVEKI